MTDFNNQISTQEKVSGEYSNVSMLDEIKERKRRTAMLVAKYNAMRPDIAGKESIPGQHTTPTGGTAISCFVSQ
jgi:hypothetical protein